MVVLVFTPDWPSLITGTVWMNHLILPDLEIFLASLGWKVDSFKTSVNIGE